MAFPKLTTEQCTTVIDWVNARLRPLQDVLDELETPERLAYLESIGAPLLDDTIKEMAAQAVTAIGGGNGDHSYKEQPTYQDVDVFFVIPNRTDDVAALTASQLGMLRSLLNRRVTDEIIHQRDLCTIDGVAYTDGQQVRRLDCLRLGVIYNNVLWSVPSRCRHCFREFADGRFRLMNGSIVHETCIAAGLVPVT